MSRRYPTAKKGKVPQSVVGPVLKRIHAPPIDNLDLIKEQNLTLIGRLTNPKVQRLWSFIPFISQHWGLTGKAIGSDLGNACFQFRFDSSEDLQMVLDNQPYHFAKYMVIIQKWEPKLSDSFPNQITFWISVKGLPHHYWKEEMLLKIGDFIGNASTVDITSSFAKVRTTVNGLKPLTKEIIIKFPKGEEVTVDLVYEKLRNHCRRCFSLRHDDRNCLDVMGLLIAPHSDKDKDPVLTINSLDSRTDNDENPLTTKTSPKECNSFSQRVDKPIRLFGPRTKSRREPHMEKASRRDHKNSSQQEMELESNYTHLDKELQRMGQNSSTRARRRPPKSLRVKDHYPSQSGANLPPVTLPRPSPLLEWRKKSPKSFKEAPEPKPQPSSSYKNNHLLKHPVLETLSRIRNNTSVFFLREFDFYQSYETCLKEGMCFWCNKNMLLYANFPCRHKLWCSSCKEEVTQAASGEKSLEEDHHRCVICDAEVERFVSVSSV